MIEEGAEPQVRMAYLAIVGSFSVNGVAALHSQLLRQDLFHDFFELWPRQVQQQDQRRHAAPLDGVRPIRGWRDLIDADHRQRTGSPI